MSQGDDATLPDTRGSAPAAGRITPADLGDRYELGEVIGRGGMGEVRIARDTRIQRDVAVKLLRSTLRDEPTLGRFFREARVQGVLDHPAVVPVHDLGIDPGGNPYFVMKRLTGTTLADVLTATGAASDLRWTRSILLRRLVDICLAIEFAHQRGVIHRDLKPANIMLGDYGEAYVLDWGLARITAEGESIARVEAVSGDNIGHTEAGDLLGTPGYMSPEQARGEAVDWRTDVFALGCVLFEILTGTPALPRGLAGISATLTAAHHRPSRVFGEAPPELDDLCARATEADGKLRPSARQLADGIGAYLDGDRDLERRRALAEEHARAAQNAMLGTGDPARALAIREAGRALALDPANATAQHVLGRLLIEAPTTMPADALRAADEERATTRQSVMRTATRTYLSLLAIVLVLLVLPLRQTWPVVLTIVSSAVSAVVMFLAAARPRPMRSPWFVAVVATTVAQMACSGLLFGPILVLPIFTIGAYGAFLSQPSAYPNWFSVVAFAIPITLVIALEMLGVLPSTIGFSDGALIIKPTTVNLTPLTTTLIIGLSLLTQIANTAFIAITTRQSTLVAQNRVHAQTWHMKQLLP